MITQEYIQNFSKLQMQLEELEQEHSEAGLPFHSIIERYLKITKTYCGGISKVEVDTGLITPSHIRVTYFEFGYRECDDQEYNIDIPIEYFINENAFEKLEAEHQAKMAKKEEAERQRKMDYLKSQLNILENEIVNLELKKSC